MSRHLSGEYPRNAQYSLLQLYNWLDKCSETFQERWPLVDRDVRDESELEHCRFMAKGGTGKMRPILFYLLGDYVDYHDNPVLLYQAIVGMMEMPFELWRYVEFTQTTTEIHYRVRENYDNNPLYMTYMSAATG